jgi:CBS domain-containing protein
MPTAVEFCNRHVATARSTETLHEVASRMRGEHVGSVVVVEATDAQLFPVGLVTDRDIVVAVLARGDRRIDTITVGEVMSTEPVTAPEGEDVTDVLKRMQSAGVRRVPIVNDRGALVGIIAFDDLFQHFAHQIDALAQLLSREQSTEVHVRPLTETSAARKPARRPEPKAATPRARRGAKGRTDRISRTSASSGRRSSVR